MPRNGIAVEFYHDTEQNKFSYFSLSTGTQPGAYYYFEGSGKLEFSHYALPTPWSTPLSSFEGTAGLYFLQEYTSTFATPMQNINNVSGQFYGNYVTLGSVSNLTAKCRISINKVSGTTVENIVVVEEPLTLYAYPTMYTFSFAIPTVSIAYTDEIEAKVYSVLYNNTPE